MALEADPYRTLGLTRGATLDEVKRAYRRLAKVNHPDAAGAGALPRFLAIQAAYEQLVGGGGGSDAGGLGAAARRRSSAADPDRRDATRRAYGGKSRETPPGSGPAAGAGRTGAGNGPTSSARRERDSGAGTRDAGRGPSGSPGSPRGPSGRPGGSGEHGASRGKATLGSTSYDGADAGPFEPDWGGASWYGTTSGTYWTINPKEYADPRKHGPEYQARARRSSRSGASGPPAGGRRQDPAHDRAADPTHTTSSWWESTSGPATSESAAPGSEPAPSVEPANLRARPATNPDRRSEAAETFRTDDPVPDPSRAAMDLGRALTDPRSGGQRGRVLRAFLGWFPLAFGLGWLVGELTGCGRFAATCDPSVGPLIAIGQGTILVALLFLPEVAALTAGAALVLLVAALAASLALSATGGAADEAARRAALGALLLVAWLSGLTIALVRRLRSGPRTAGPVS